MTITLVAAALLTHGSTDSGSDILWGSDGDKVVVSGRQTTDTPDRDASPESRESTAPKTDDPCENVPVVRRASCGFSAVKVTAPDGDPLTITDLVEFAPAPVSTVGEPGNVGVVGLPVNFLAAAGTHTRSGTLLDLPVTVRFTPVSFEFLHGDGTSVTTTTAGSSWASLGQAPFTPTPTSHTYTQRGTFAAQVTVRYTAEVDIGNGWFPVEGELPVPGATQEIRIFEARTALVEHTCTERPTDPGC